MIKSYCLMETQEHNKLAEQTDNLAVNSAEETSNNIAETTIETMSEKDIQKVEESTVETEKTAETISEKDIQKVEESTVETEKTAETISEKVTVKTETTIDYTTYSKEELLKSLTELMVLENDSAVMKIKIDVEIIRNVFYKKHNLEVENLKKDFIEKGEKAEDFKPTKDVVENKFKEIYKKFRDLRTSYNLKIEKEKENNLNRKYEIIDEIKNLINKKESLNQTFDDFKRLQKEWREIGLVTQSEVKNLWETYHHNVEKFYDFVKINKELRDLDLKKNLKVTVEICEKAEELLLEESIVKAFNLLQKYHEQWRETGPVPREKKDEVWERFKKLTTVINKKHFDYFEEQKRLQQINLQAKNILLNKVKEITSEEYIKHKDWEDRSKEIIEIQKIWKTIGFAPKKENNTIYAEFREICDNFFNKKREFYLQSREEQTNNLQRKIDLCVQAESLKDSNEWKKTTDEYISIQKDWKKIGPVSKADSDKIWKRFRSACDDFFNKKSDHFKNLNSSQEDNLKLKLELIESMINFELTGNDAEDLDKLKNFQKTWMEIGFVPFDKKDEIQKSFKDLINGMFEKFRLGDDDESRKNDRFRNRIENMQNSPKGNFKIKKEKEKVNREITKIDNDIKLWENNIGFFAKSKNADALIEEVKQKIEKSKERLSSLKERIQLMDKEENTELTKVQDEIEEVTEKK